MTDKTPWSHCEGCDAGMRLTPDGVHYDDDHGGATWGVCRFVVNEIEARQSGQTDCTSAAGEPPSAGAGSGSQ